MLEFKEITIDDKQIIQSFTLNSSRRNCDLSFANLFSWKFFYHTQYAIAEGFLVLRFFADGELSYMMPIGEGNLKTILSLMIDDANSQGKSFQMLGICVWMKSDIETAMPGIFKFESDHDYADYIYNREDLTTLSGKKYQPKRNHINKFKKTYPNYKYEPITKELVPQCLELEAKWCKANNCHEQTALEAERQSMTCALQNFEELGLTGGILYVDEQIVAFTYGMPINNDTFDICVEKADADIDGAYPMINFEFANRIPEQYIYINREEDLGIEGLRKAKLSYHPAILLEKCITTLTPNNISPYENERESRRIMESMFQ